MIDATKLDLEELKDLLYDIRDGRVKDEDVYWGYLRGNTEVKEVTYEVENLETDLTAIQARKIMEEAIADDEYKNILKDILFMAQGKVDYLYVGKLNPLTTKKLEELGYKIEIYNPQIYGYNAIIRW